MRTRKVFLLLAVIFTSCQLLYAQTGKTDSSITIKVANGKYILSGAVADENSRNKIIEKVRTQLSVNADFTALKVNPLATSFKLDWEKDFDKSLLKLKSWKIGVFIFAGGTNRINKNYPMFLPADILNADIFLLDKKEPVRLADYRNKLVAVFFLEAWCYPCVLQAVEFKNLSSQFSSQIEIIGLSSDPKDKSNFRKLAEREKFNYSLGWADGKLIDSAVKISKFDDIPQTFLIYNGKLYGVFHGGSEKVNKEIKEAIEKLLKENNL